MRFKMCQWILIFKLHTIKMQNLEIDESRVYLWVKGYGDDASVVTTLIGLKPTYVNIPRQPIPQFPKMTARINSWEFHSPLPPDAHIDDHVEALLQLLEPYAKGIRAASETFQAGINAVVYYYQDFTPGHGLTAHQVKVLASMNLSIDYDLYFLGGADAPQEPESEAV